MSGVGRGRGWLNLKKHPPNINSSITMQFDVSKCLAVHPQMFGSMAVGNEDFIYQDASNEQQQDEVLTGTEYDGIIQSILDFGACDDGILLNQKFRYVTETIESTCTDGAQIEEAFRCLFSKALANACFNAKFTQFVSLHSFTDLHIHNTKPSAVFLKALQSKCENAQRVYVQSRVMYRNLVNILTGYFSTHKLQALKIAMIPVVVQVLGLLLNMKRQDDYELFTTKLHQCGTFLSQNATQCNELKCKMRIVLATSNALPMTCRYWLLLAIDLASYGFTGLPDYLRSFYEAHLQHCNVFDFKKIASITEEPLHVVDTSNGINSNGVFSDETIHNEQTLAPHAENIKHNKQSRDNVPRNDIRPSTGRPILGAGAGTESGRNGLGHGMEARSAVNRVRDIERDNGTSNWKKSNKSDFLPRSGGFQGNDEGSNVNRRARQCWDHDDRTETDYN